MKKILFLLFTLTLASCMQETSEQRKITVSIGQVAVRTAFSSDREKLSWETGDRIGVYHDASGIQNSLLEYKGDSQMTVSLPVDAAHIYSIFPYSSSAGEAPHNVSVTIPSRQTQKEPGVLSGVMWPMAAAAAIEEDHADLMFCPLSALLGLNIYSSEPETDESVTQVRVTPTVNRNFCGKAGMDITSGDAFTSGDSSSPITLTVTNPRPLESA